MTEASSEPRVYAAHPAGSAHLGGRLLVHSLLSATARRLPHKIAVLVDDRSTTYAELDALATRLANGLRALGGLPGEVVAVQLPNTVEHIAFTYGIARAGMVITPLNPRWSADEISACVEDAGARLVVGDRYTTPAEVLAAGSDVSLELDLPETHPIHLRYTSGTTGRPKASLNTHRSLALFEMGIAIEFGLREEDVFLSVAPLTHAAVYFAQAVLTVGGTVILKPTFDLRTLWTDCDRYGVTSTLVVPTIAAMAMDSPGEATALRNLVSLGAPLTTTLKERLLARFPHLGLHEMYGATELSMATNLRPVDQLRKPRSVGQARFGYEVAIFDDEGSPIPKGEIGTIYARGLSTHVGYVGAVKGDAPPARLAADGWMSVGDLGHLDEEGFLFISDRRADLIVSGGMNVYPSEVENVLMEVTGVREVAVIGIPDETWGRRVAACVVGDVSTEDLDRHCRTRLAGYKVPRIYLAEDELPKSAVGKILRRELTDRYGAPSS